MAILYRTNGTNVELFLAEENILDQLQKAVEGPIELVKTPEAFYIVNGEGLVFDFPQNPTIEPFVGNVVKLTALEMALL